MADSDKTIILPENGNGWNNSGIPLALALNGGWNNNGWGNGGFFGGSGFFPGLIGGLLGGFLPGLLSGNGFGGWGGNNGGAAAASLGAQATANANTDLIIQAINGTDSDVRLLATTLNSDVDSIRLAINTVQGAIQTVGAQLGLTGQQVINSIQAGNSDIAARICDCCCNVRQLVQEQGFQNQLATVNQTNAIEGSISAASQRNVDAIADLKATMIQSFCDVKEREMQSKIDTQADIITQLRNQADNAAQSLQLNAGLSALNNKVTDLACKLPATTPVIYPQITAVNTTPNYGFGFGGFGNGFNGWGYGFPGGSYWG